MEEKDKLQAGYLKETEQHSNESFVQCNVLIV